MHRLDHGQSANARTDVNAETLGVGFADVYTAVPERLDARGNAEMNEEVHVPGFLGWHVVFDREILDFPGDMARNRQFLIGRIEAIDAADARFPGERRRPRRLDAVPERAHDTQTRDHYPALIPSETHLRSFDRCGLQAFLWDVM